MSAPDEELEWWDLSAFVIRINIHGCADEDFILLEHPEKTAPVPDTFPEEWVSL